MKTTATTITPPPKETYVLGLTDSEIISLQALYMLAVTIAVVGLILVYIGSYIKHWLVARQEKKEMAQIRQAIKLSASAFTDKMVKEKLQHESRETTN
jgi:hypothetical protein